MPSAITSSSSALARSIIIRTNESWSASADAVDERLGDLEDVQRQRVQVAQRRVARAEVVERQAHAELAQRVQRRDAALGVLEQLALGDLEHEVDGRDAGVLDRARGPSSIRSGWRSSTAQRLTCTERIGAAARRCQRRAWRHASRSTKRPIATIMPVSSASGMNSAGMIRAALGVLPAHERLGGGGVARGERDDRLVVDGQLAALDGAAQVVLHLAAVQHQRPAPRGRSARSSALPAILAWYIAMSAWRISSSSSAAPWLRGGDADAEADREQLAAGLDRAAGRPP